MIVLFIIHLKIRLWCFWKKKRIHIKFVIIWFQLTQDMANNVPVWWLGWPVPDDLDLLRFEEFWGRDSSIRGRALLKNLPPLVVWDGMGRNKFLIAIHHHAHERPQVFHHLTWLFLCESWVHVSSNGASAVFAAIWTKLNCQKNLWPLFHCPPFLQIVNLYFVFWWGFFWVFYLMLVCGLYVIRGAYCVRYLIKLVL